MSFYNGSRADTKPGGRTTGFGEGLPNFSDARAKLSYDRPIFSERFKNFSPSAKKSGEEILKDLKEQLRREGDMFFNNSPPDWGFNPKSTLFSKADDGEDFARRSGMDDIRGRHPMFRMPPWMSEDEDMSDLAARMSHTPHFATMGRRGGPWRERRSSGGSAMSATSDDSCDAPHTDKSSQCSGGSSDGPSHEIPIRIEAPCPPSMVQQPQPQQQQQQQHQPQNTNTEPENEPISPLSSAFSQRKGTQFPVRTTSAVDATHSTEDVPRTTRCSSAPPEMADQPLPQDTHKPNQQQRFVSKINITPQSPQSPVCSKTTAIPFSPLPAKFNTVPKPFVPANKQQSEAPAAAPYVFEQPTIPEPPQQQESQQQQGHPPQQPQMPPYMTQHQPPQQHPPQQQQPFQSHHQFQPPHQQQQQQQQQSPRLGSQRPSIVRNIPIFVEGRDVPVTNEDLDTPQKSTPQWGPSWQQQQFHQQQPTQQQQYHQQQPTQQQYHQQQPTPQQQYYQQQPAPQQQYYQQQSAPQQQQHYQAKPQFRQQSQPRQQTTQQQSQPIPTPMPAPPPPQQQQQQEQHQPQPEPQPKPQPAKDPRLTQIEAVQASVDEYKAKVDAFSGTKKDREFLYLDEMLTRALLQLDNVDPDGREDVRQARRAVIKNINAAISALEAKASDSKEKEKGSENSEVSLETDSQEQSAETKESQEAPDQTSDNKDPAVTLSNNNNTDGKNAEQSNAETTESQDTNSVKETTVTTSS